MQTLMGTRNIDLSEGGRIVTQILTQDRAHSRTSCFMCL